MSKKSIKSDLKRIDAMTDENIDYSDIPPLGDEFLTQETVSFSTSKQQLTIQPMADLIVRNIDEAIVKALKKRASQHGISAEAEHR